MTDNFRLGFVSTSVKISLGMKIVEISTEPFKISRITYQMENFIINYFIIAIVTIYGANIMAAGEPATEGQFKYVVSIQQQNVHHCSGIIIDEMHIVTAANAVIAIPRSFLSVVAGKVLVTSPMLEAVPVAWIYFHYHFERTGTTMWPYEDSWTNDIAVLRLGRKFTWSPNIAPAPLIDRAKASDSCNSCIMPGWYHELPNSEKSVRLHWIFVYREDNRDGQGNRIMLADDQRCIGDLLQLTMITKGDVGVPVVCNNYVVGFVVKGGEALDRPSIFLEIFPYLDFLLDVINGYKIPALQGQLPYSASLWYGGEYLCSGIIYDAIHVITVEPPMKNISEKSLKVIAGRIQVRKTDDVQSGILVEDIATIREVTSDVYVDSVVNEFVRHGIAVLTLSQPVTPDLVVQLQFGDTSYGHPDQVCRVLRWFRKDHAGQAVRELKTSPAIVLTRAQCGELGLNPRARQFCALNPYSRILAEQEDIGNPILCRGRVIGLVLKTISPDPTLARVPVIFMNVHLPV